MRIRRKRSVPGAGDAGPGSATAAGDDPAPPPEPGAGAPAEPSAYEFGGRLIRLLRHHRIDVVLDVGANIGWYGQLLRSYGYPGRIVSFEPLHAEHGELAEVAASDPGWSTHCYGLAERSGSARINVAANSQSSSVLPMLPAHLEAAPHSAYLRTEEIALHRLDDVFGDVVEPGERAFMKLDVQGLESRVLDGAARSIPKLQGLQMEMSMLPLYEGEMLFQEAVDRVLGYDMSLCVLEPGFTDETSGRMLQVDGVFFRD